MFADILMKSNAVFSGNSDHVEPGFVAIKGNKIIGTGSLDQAAKLQGKDTKVLDFGSQMILPGFIDNHFHFFVGSIFQSSYYVDLASSRSEEEAVALVKAHLDANPTLDHIFGWGWFITDWTDHKLPSRKSLDEALPDIPVYMFSNDGHTCWLNTKALEQCEITTETTVKYGKIEKDENGDLTGLLYENDALSSAVDYAVNMAEEEWTIVEEKMYQYLSENGITSLADVSNGTSLTKEPPAYSKLLKTRMEGKLNIRVHLYPSLGDDGDFTLAKQLREKYNYPDLKVAGLKTFVDGTTSLYTGCMLEPYTDKSDEIGAPNFPPELYNKLLSGANKEGFGVKFHAIGDRAVRIVLDAIEASKKENDLTEIRNCIEHAENVHPSDIPRFKELNATASLQIVHLPLDNNEKANRIGKKRARYEWPLRSLLDAGATFAAGTDFPVFEVNPMIGIYTALTRCLQNGNPVGCSPEEKITLPEILQAYTKNSAYSIGRDDIGTLEAGKLADIVVLDKNLFDAAPEEILATRPVMTMMDGRIVFQK